MDLRSGFRRTPHLKRRGTGKPPGGAAPASDDTRPGTKEILKRVLRGIQEDDVPGQAAKVAFFAFMSLPPALMVLFGLTGFLGGEATAEWVTARLQSTAPGEAAQLITSFVDQVVHESAPGPFSLGLALALWAASGVFMALGDALNKTYSIVDRRSWAKRRATALGVMLAFALLLLLGSGVVLAGPYLARAMELGATGAAVWAVIQLPVAFLLVVGAFWVVYFVLPNRDQSAHKRELLKGAVIAATAWVGATTAFRIGVANFGSFHTYGVLGAVILLLLWLWVTGIVVLTGGELASELEKRA